MVELLKQANGEPVSFFKQASVIYAGINGHLDTIATEKLKAFETALYEKLDTSYSNLAEDMRTKKELTKEIEDSLKELISKTLSELA
jgi:F-type H+-transporting ATPase subunit alpha